MISNHKSRVDAFVGQISSSERPIEVVDNQSFDAQFSVLVTYQVLPIITKVKDSDIKGQVKESLEGREQFDTFIANETSASKFIQNITIVSSSRVSNFGSLTAEVKGGEESYVTYREVCNSCSGLGKIGCKQCGGMMVVACSCKGVGCKKCKLHGKVRCGYCDHEGKQDCPVCLNKKTFDEAHKIELRIKAVYEMEFNEATDEKVKSIIKSFGRPEDLKSKGIVYINSTSNLFIDDDGLIKARYFLSCPVSIVHVKLAEKIEEVILYGITQRIIDLSGFTEKVLGNEEERLFQVISDTNVIGGSYDELIACVNDYASIDMHMKIITARNNLFRRQIKPTAELVSEELEYLLSAEYIERFLKNVEGAISLAAVCVKASYLIPALAAFPFLYALVGIWLEDPVRIIVSVLIVIGGYFYTSLMFENILKKNGGDAILKMRIPTI
ncbi:MAG: hypothetical protein ACTS9Y_00965 [Methylophilus sp.]|uniref:hypothetical protein n=1 Tax=Methylophilus sp. TaxID=29541 RepID=UPI003FA131D1